jgi:excisionase family DNA binding protein
MADKKTPRKAKESDKDSEKGKAAPEKKKQEPLATLAEVATMLRMPPLQVKKLVQTGQIPGVKVDGEWRFNKDLVYQAMKRRSLGR